MSEKFMFRLRKGLALPDEIDNEIDLWHRSSSELSLADFLGMTPFEYQSWVEQPGSLERLSAK